MIDVFNLIGAIVNPNGKVPPMPEQQLITLPNWKGKEENHHQYEFTIGNWDYIALFDVDYKRYSNDPDEIIVDILRIQKCHAIHGNEYYTVRTFTFSEFQQIENEILEYWEQTGNADLYNDLNY